MIIATPTDLMSPVHDTPEDAGSQPEQGLALCLSGGGYRAMVFHAGVLWRLNEVGLLPKLDRVSTVSGGSITSGVLATNWADLKFDKETGVATNLVDKLVQPVRQMSSTAVDIRAVLTGVLPFGDSVSDRVAEVYRNHLFGDTSLQDLPDTPRFVFNATNLESGVLLRFSKPYLGDYRVGRIMKPDLPLAVVVAASSAFPPVLSPCTLELRGQTWITDEGNDLTSPGFRDEIRVTDGGVYDNLGVETAWKRYTSILVSDAGGSVAEQDDPATDWLSQTARVLMLIDNQVRSLRKRQVIESLTAGLRTGMYVGIGSRIENFGDAVLLADPERTDQLAGLPTRLAPMDTVDQEGLINWGYTVCDAGLRTHYLKDKLQGTPKTGLPYPEQVLS